jgi:hypothetical protein
MVGQLERRAEAISGEFNSQNVANTLWAYAKMGTKPGERMVGQLERRAEAISGEFNSQEVANTLWAYATMGTKPGERMMGQLERRAEAISGEFNSEDVASTMWAYVRLAKDPTQISQELMPRAEILAGEFDAAEIAITFWSASYFRIDIAPGLVRRAASVLQYAPMELCQLAESVFCYPHMPRIQSECLCSVFKRDLIGRVQPLRVHDMIHIVSCLFESVCHEKTVTELLSLLKLESQENLSSIYSKHAVCRVQVHRETWDEFKNFIAIIHEVRRTFRVSDLYVDISALSADAYPQMSTLSNDTARASFIAKVVGKVPNSHELSPGDINREFNGMLQELMPPIEELRRDPKFLPPTYTNNLAFADTLLRPSFPRSCKAKCT